MLRPKEVRCPECDRVRLIDYRHLWLIKKGETSEKCFKCSRMKRGQVNAGSFKKGVKLTAEQRAKLRGRVPWNKEKVGWRKEKVLTEEERISRKLEQGRIYRLKNRNELNEKQKVYNKNNLEKKRNYLNLKYKNDLQFKLKVSLRNRISRALKRGQKNGSAVRDLGCSVDELKTHLESKFLPGMTWDNWKPDGWHIDHVVALYSFDLTDRKQFLKACHYTNLQPLWAKDNSRKDSIRNV